MVLNPVTTPKIPPVGRANRMTQQRGGEARSMTISWSCVQRTYASEETEDWASAQEPGLDYSLGVFEQRFHDHHSDKLSLAN